MRNVFFFASGGSSNGSTKSATIEMYVGSSSYGGNDTMSGETLSSISEKSGSYLSNGNHPHHGHHHHHHHVHQHHHQRPARLPPTDEDAEEEDAFDGHQPDVVKAAASTYLTDSPGSVVANGSALRASSYATMPRKPITGGSFLYQPDENVRQHHTLRSEHRGHRDEDARQQYIQSLGK